ncbi:MAG: dihydropteridine reductase [Clostridia bacterium]|nr:dihydropteridine reductase [Clostridia bacterium]
MKSQETIIKNIKSRYLPKETVDFDKLKQLDKSVKRPAQIFGYVHGSIASLILGVGMCMAMEVISGGMVLGIGVGLIGILLVSTTYAMHKAILNKRKNKYSEEILKLSDSILNK